VNADQFWHFVSSWPRSRRARNLLWNLMVPHMLASYFTIALFALLMLLPNVHRIGITPAAIALAPVSIFLYLGLGVGVMVLSLGAGLMAFTEGAAWFPLMVLAYALLFWILRVIFKELREDH
jgi:hypothetical protein